MITIYSDKLKRLETALCKEIHAVVRRHQKRVKGSANKNIILVLAESIEEPTLVTFHEQFHNLIFTGQGYTGDIGRVLSDFAEAFSLRPEELIDGDADGKMSEDDELLAEVLKDCATEIFAALAFLKDEWCHHFTETSKSLRGIIRHYGSIGPVMWSPNDGLSGGCIKAFGLKDLVLVKEETVGEATVVGTWVNDAMEELGLTEFSAQGIFNINGSWYAEHADDLISGDVIKLYSLETL